MYVQWPRSQKAGSRYVWHRGKFKAVTPQSLEGKGGAAQEQLFARQQCLQAVQILLHSYRLHCVHKNLARNSTCATLQRVEKQH